MTTETRAPALWRNVPYAWLWAGQTVSRFGTAITMVAFPLLVLELAPSAQVVGTASALITLGWGYARHKRREEPVSVPDEAGLGGRVESRDLTTV